MPSLLNSIINRVQQAATPDAPPPLPIEPVSSAPAFARTRPVQSVAPLEIARRATAGSSALPADLLKSTLDVADRQPERSRKGRPGYIHVSSLIEFCARAQVISVMRDVQTFQEVTGGHRVMWKIGRAVEQHVRSEFIKATRNATPWGVWKCLCQRTDSTGMQPPSSNVCPTCRGSLDHYHEFTLLDHENGVVGNPDLLLLLNNQYVINEIKSMTGEQFKELTAPLGDHIFQAAMYQRLATLQGWAVAAEVVIFYVNKNFKFGSPYKEFHVDVTAPGIQRQVDEALALAREAKAHIAGRITPPRTVCANQTCTRSKSCPVSNFCFNMP